MRYACLIYFDPRKVFDGSPESNAVLTEVGPADRALHASGHFITSLALQLPDAAVTVRVRDGQMSTTDGPFMETKEVLGGFLLIEAKDRDEAVEIAARSPFARLGCVEVRPEVDFSGPRPEL
jgi:hypothetical protein